MKTKEKLIQLEEDYDCITLYRNFDTKNLFKGIGRIPGSFDKEVLEFLKFTNGASIMDYCFLGIKNNKLGVNLDEFVLELWGTHDFLAGKIIPFMINSSGETFGFLLEGEGEKNPIVFHSNEFNEEEVLVISSSFNNFMSTFTEDVESTLVNSKDDIFVQIEIEKWPYKLDHWLSKDENLEEILKVFQVDKNGFLNL